MRQKKITFFLGGMTRGGAERVISILSKEYAERGWDTDICVLLFYQLDYEIDKRTRFLDFTGKEGSRITHIPYWLYHIRKYAKEEQPDVIVSFAARINALVQLACTGLHIPVVVSERVDPRYDGRGLIIKTFNNLYYPHAKKVVFQTKRMEEYFNQRIRNNGCIIKNPVLTLDRISGTRRKKIVAAGRIVKQKNHKLLIESFSDIVKIYPQYELWIYGEGGLKDELMRLNREIGTEDKVHFPGNIPNIHREMADAEMFVLSSDYEGLSNALMEAMMMGLPCISTRCSGSDEIIEDGINGLLVPVNDRKAMTKAILHLIEHPELEEKIGNSARETVKEFETENIINQWMEII